MLKWSYLLDANMTSDDTTTINELRQKVQKFVDDRDWNKYHNPKDVAISIAIEAAELMEHFQWIKENELDEVIKEKSAELQDELADILIYCLSFANSVGIDISHAVTQKIQKNESKYPIEEVKGNYKKYTEIRNNKPFHQ